jgi:hypothetical protein
MFFISLIANITSVQQNITFGQVELSMTTMSIRNGNKFQSKFLAKVNLTIDFLKSSWNLKILC